MQEIDAIIAALITAGVGGAVQVLRVWIRGRKIAAPAPLANGNGGVAALDAYKTIGAQQAALIASYKEAAERAESRADRLEQEKEAMTDELMKQAAEIAKLRADVSILEAQVAALLKQVEKLERKS